MSRVAAGALALLALLPACGTASRAALLQPGLRDATTPEELRAIRGADPLVPYVWLVSTSRAKTPQEALAIVERGLQYLPGEPDLVWLRLSLLAQMGERPQELAGATAALGVGAPDLLVIELLGFRLDAHLAQDDPAAAAEDVLAMGSVSGVEPAQVASAWAAVALAWQVLGNPQEADDAFQLSLASGPHGLVTLRQGSGLDPVRMRAAAAIVERALERTPDQPDLQLYLAVQDLLDGDAAAASAVLAALPEPLPPRLVADREALVARVDLLQGRVDQAVALLRVRLDADPAETGALAVMLESWRAHGRPDDAEMRWRLKAALGRVRDPSLRKVLSTTLAELDRRAAEASKGDAPGTAPGSAADGAPGG